MHVEQSEIITEEYQISLTHSSFKKVMMLRGTENQNVRHVAAYESV